MRRTPLYDAHRALGGRMVDFAGWEMPVQYSGIIDEHIAVRTRAGLFDVSHMGEVAVRGGGALAACQQVTANDVARLADGQAQYTLLLTPAGGIVDDVIIHRRAADDFLFCVNAANRERSGDGCRGRDPRPGTGSAGRATAVLPQRRRRATDAVSGSEEQMGGRGGRARLEQGEC